MRERERIAKIAKSRALRLLADGPFKGLLKALRRFKHSFVTDKEREHHLVSNGKKYFKGLRRLCKRDL